MFKHQYLQMFGVINISNFQPLEVVGRGRETQLQVGENLADKGFNAHAYN